MRKYLGLEMHLCLECGVTGAVLIKRIIIIIIIPGPNIERIL